MRAIGALFGALALGACAATLPTGPTVMALPAQGKSFVDFQQDDLDCRQYAAQQTGGVSPSETARESLAGNAPIRPFLPAPPAPPTPPPPGPAPPPPSPPPIPPP